MDTIVGHYAQKSALRENNKVNVWLLCGKRGIGKASLASAFAKQVVESDALDSHPDVAIIEDKTSPIGIEKIHKMRNFLHMSTISAERKVVILDSLDELNTSAVNSMLKILEEPPESSLILLISHNLYNVPVVIRSRCVILRFSDLTPEETKEVIRLNFPDMGLEDRAVYLYTGIPGMVTEDIEKEISLYESFMSLIREGGKNNALGNLLETDLPIHKIEYLGLKALYDTVSSALELQKNNVHSTRLPNIQCILEKYFKAQEIFSTSRKLHAHREVTIFRIAETISNLVKHEN